MKKLSPLKLVICLSLFFTACQENTKDMLIGKWVVVEAEMFPTEQSTEEDKEYINQVNKEVINQLKEEESFFELKKDGTYEQYILGDQGSGTWELKKDNKTLVNENGDLLTIEELSKEKFVMTRENEEYGFRIVFGPAKK